jgi:hypothetical protein
MYAPMTFLFDRLRTTWVVGLCGALLLGLAPLAATAQNPGEPAPSPVEAPNSVLELRGNTGVFTDTGCNSGATDGNELGCWADQSGENNDATAGTLTGPDLATGVSGLNGQDVVLFDRTTNSNTGEGLGPADTDDINTAMGGYAERTITLAIRTPGDVNTNRQVIYEEGDASHGFNVYLDGSGSLVAAAWSDNWTGDHFSTSTSVSANTSYVVTLVFDADGTNNLELFVDGSSVGTASDAGIGTMPTHSGDVGIGNVVDGTQFGASTEVTGTGNEGFAGHVAELQLFNDAVNAAQRQILESALAERYGISPITNDRYAYSGYSDGVNGVGQAGDGTRQTPGASGVLTVRADALDDGEFALVGHNGNAESFVADTDPDDVSQRLDRVWRYDATNGPSVDLRFDVSGFSLGSGEEYRVLVEGSGGTFGSGASVVDGTVSNDTLTVTASTLSNAGLSDGDYVTLAIAAQPKTPQNLTATVAGSQKVDLSWDDVSENTNGDPATIDKYRIYRNNQNNPSGNSRGSGFSEATLIDSTTGMSTSFQATGLTSGSQYFFWVVAVNGAGASTEQVPPAAATPAPFGDTGPGGVGATDGTGRLKIWLRGDQGVSTSGSDVNRWNDQSGYGHDFEAGTSPSTTTLNGREALSFNGSSQWLGSTSNLTTDNGNSGPPDDIPETNYTQFVVFNTTDSDGAMLAVTDPVDPTAGRHDREFGFLGGDLSNRLFQGGTEPGVSGANDGTARVGGAQVELGEGEAVLLDGSQAATGPEDESDFNYEAGMVIGGQASSSYGYYNGTIAEVVLYNDVLNKAEETIVQNYLATKYGASLAGSVDKYAYDGTYGNDLVGIGRASASANHLTSTTSILEVSAGSFAGDGNYVFLGHDGGTASSFGYESTEPINGRSSNAERMEREWRADLSGTSSKTVTVSISGGDLPIKQAGYEYVLIVDSGDKFNTSPRAYTLKDGGGGSCEQADATCSADVALDDGDYVTVGAGARVVNFQNTTAQASETAGTATITAELNLPYPSSSMMDVSVEFTHTGDLDGSSSIEDSGSGNTNDDYEASDSDYDVEGSNTSPQTKTISAGNETTDITINLNNDSDIEQTEKFEAVVQGGSTTNAGAGPDKRTVFSIQDDDEPRKLFVNKITSSTISHSSTSISPSDDTVSTAEGDGGGTVTVKFEVGLRDADSGGKTAASSEPCTSVRFNVDRESSEDPDSSTVVTGDVSSKEIPDVQFTDGSNPTSGDDNTCSPYQTRDADGEGGRVYFEGGTTAATIEVSLNQDDIDDLATDSLRVDLASPLSASLSEKSTESTTANFVIEDDDSAPNVLFASQESSGDESTNGNVSVTLSSVSSKEVTVDFAVNSSSSTAQQPGDFSLGTSSPLAFPADQEVTSKAITVNVSDDSKNELDETVVLDLNNPSNATLGGTTTHTYTINDNDAALVGASGPGGVGATDGTGKLNVWLEGDSVTTSGSKVTTWIDQSGYDHDFTQGTDSERPTAEVLNDRKVLSFDGSDDWLGSTNLSGSDIPETDYTQFLVFKTSDTDGAAVSVVDPVEATAGQHDRNFGIQGSKLANRIFSNETISSSSDFNDGTVYVGAVQVEKGEGQLLRADGTQVASGTKDESDFSTESGIVIGRHDNSFGAFGGEIGEFALFDRVLNDTRTTLIENHLAAKYGATLDNGDVYAGDKSGNGNYDDGVFGVGRESTDDFHAKAGRDGLNLSNVSGLDENGDYLTLGHRRAVNGVNTSDVSGPSGLEARLDRTWYTDLSNDSGTSIEVDVQFDLSEAGLDGSAGTAGNYLLLRRTADPTTNADSSWTSLATASSTANDSITFSNVSSGLQDGTEITLGTTDEGASPLGGQAAIVLQGTAGNEGSGRGSTGGDAGFALLGPPEEGGTFEGLASDTDPQAIEFDIPGPMIYTYDASTDSWDEVTGAESGNAMTNGEGFLFFVFDDEGYADADPVDPTLPLTVSDGSGTPSSDVTVSGLGTGDQWVFLSNPYGVPFDLETIQASGNSQDINAYSTTVQVWDRVNETWDPGLTLNTGADGMDDKRVGVGQGFFLECTDYQNSNCPTQVTLPTSGKITGSRDVIGYEKSSAKSSERIASLSLSMSVTQGADTVARDRAARVLFYEEATAGWDRYDATKLAPFLAEYATLSPLSSVGDTVRSSAQASRPWPTTAEAVEVPLKITTVGVSGQATVRMPETWKTGGWSVEVVDTKGTADPSDDEVHALTVDGEGYTFTLGAAKHGGATAKKRTRSPDSTSSRRAWEPGALALSERVQATERDRTAVALVRGVAGPSGPEGTQARTSGTKAGSGAAPQTRLKLRVTPPQSALPVEMTDFTARADGADAVLKWQTASETNNAGFYVEHRRRRQARDTTGTDSDAPSGETGEWSRLGFVEGAGTTTEPQAYRFRADELEYGAHAFRLRQVDTGGSQTTTEPVTVERRLSTAYAVEPPYPNPATQQATLPVTVREAQRVTVRIYDVLGRRVRTVRAGKLAGQKTRTVQLSTHDLASGQYFVRVRGDSFSVTRRLMVVR